MELTSFEEFEKSFYGNGDSEVKISEDRIELQNERGEKNDNK